MSDYQPSLSIAEYELAQRLGSADLPVSILWAFQPAHFSIAGYPSSVSSERELAKFLDIMSAGDLDTVFLRYLDGGLTDAEFSRLSDLSARLLSFSNRAFGKPILALPTACRAFNTLRHLRYLFPDKSPRIFEVGPGSGFHGALLQSEGLPYASTDVTQAFYLLQNHLWNGLKLTNVAELAHLSSEISLPTPQSGLTIHLPWWKYTALEVKQVPSFDVVLCNHALCEMHNWSMRYTLAMAREMLRANDGFKAFIFEGWGDPDITGDYGSVEEAFETLGFKQAYRDTRITVYLPPSHADSDRLRFVQEQIVRGRALSKQTLSTTSTNVRALGSQLLGGAPPQNADDKFLEFIGGGQHPYPHVIEKIKALSTEVVPQLASSSQQHEQLLLNIAGIIEDLLRRSQQLGLR
jgi:hypothetical protein